MSYLVHNWRLDPFVFVVALLVVLHEVGLAHLRRRSVPERTRRRRHRSLLFYAGLALLLLAVMSPVDYWAGRYFFVHMIEHILLTFFAPILIVAGAPWLPLVHGLPVGVRRRVGRAVLLGRWAVPVRAVGRFVCNPWTALVSFNAVMIFWHIPAPFDLAQENRVVHIWLMHASFLVTGVLFWLQIIPSYPFRIRVSALWQMGAVIGTNFVMFVLAMSLSLFTSVGWYSVYAHVPGVALSPFADQQIGAAILWICGDFWAVPALAVIIKRAIDRDGGFSEAVDRMLHRDPGLTLEALGTPALPERGRPG
jgi:putative membrane protein